MSNGGSPQPGQPPLFNLSMYSIQAPISPVEFYVAAPLAKQVPDPFLHSLIHEIRNPLTNIVLSVELLGELLKGNDSKEFLEIIARNAERINNLIVDFLSYSQAPDMHSGSYYVCPLIDEVLAIVRDRLLLKNVTVSKAYISTDMKVTLNQQQVKIGITNIILNSIEAMPKENGKLKLVVKTVKDKCVVKIEDNGCGIKKENLRQIATPFFTKRKGGLGMGMSTAARIFRQNNIDLIVRSKPDRGTRFILTFGKSE
jgi:signal transduction histidine kinase